MAAQRAAATGNPFGLLFLFLFYLHFAGLITKSEVLIEEY